MAEGVESVYFENIMMRLYCYVIVIDFVMNGFVVI